MYQRILVATDGSEVATEAVRRAGRLAAGLGASLTIVTVTEQAPTFSPSEIGWSVPASVFDDIRKANRDRSQAILDRAAEIAGTRAELAALEEQRPYDGILSTARQIGADLIVMGSNGRRGLERLLLGSQAAKVVSMAEVSVLIVRP